MATCRTCAYLRKCIEKATKEGYEHNVSFDPKDGCTGIGYKSNTNADRIRAMSDEELSKFLECFGLCHHCTEHHRLGDVRFYQDEKCDEQCEQHCLEWLKQPVKGD